MEYRPYIWQSDGDADDHVRDWHAGEYESRRRYSRSLGSLISKRPSLNDTATAIAARADNSLLQEFMQATAHVGASLLRR